jgi:Putative adhesin
VSASALVVVGCLAALVIWGVTAARARVVSFDVRGTLQGVTLDLGDGGVEVVRGGTGSGRVSVQRTEHYAFSHAPRVSRSVTDGVLRLRSRCPVTVTHSCSAEYRVVVPDNVPVDVRTTTGAIRLSDYHGSARIATVSGDVDVRDFCGFSLQVRAETGDVGVTSPCAPQRLSLRSTRGAVHAVVPPGRYQVDAESASGRQQVRGGIENATDAPFSIQALSTSGDVLVEGRG